MGDTHGNALQRVVLQKRAQKSALKLVPTGRCSSFDFGSVIQTTDNERS